MDVRKLKRKSKLFNQLLLTVILTFFTCALTFGQKQKILHQSNETKAYNYKIGQNVIFENGDNIFFAVSIEKDRYDYEKIIATIFQLRCLHPDVAKLGIIILDNHQSAERLTDRQADNPTYEKDHSAVRGFYSFDKNTGVEYFDIALEKGVVKQKYEINLSKSQCLPK